VSLWKRLRDRVARRPGERDAAADRAPDSSDPRDVTGLVMAPATDAQRATQRPARVDEVAELARLGEPEGPTTEEALAILRRARGTEREAEAVQAALLGQSQRALPEQVRIACADILAARGDEEQALRLLGGVSSSAGLILAADLFAANGQLARAVGTIERLLARELDAPGARERHRRWRASLGFTGAPVRRLDEATVVAAVPARGPYRLLREVARGGAGAVYEAEDELLGRRVAFKVYHRRGEDRALLEREARTAVQLAGPGVVRVLDLSPVEGWVALEWIGRGSVRDVLRTGGVATLVPIERWARPLARALARVHAADLVHADVKPANVLLRQASEPVLGDFGIARPRGAPAEGGSPGYLSPERLGGRASDPRDDVYAYGRVLEDVLARIEAADLPPDAGLEPWRELAMVCLGRDEDRPEDGAALCRSLP
jgi:serine/threonine-protein kinase